MSAVQMSPDVVYVKPGYFPLWPLWLFFIVYFVVILYEAFIEGRFPDYSEYAVAVFGGMAMLSSIWLLPRYFITGFLVTLLFFLVSWRIAAMMDVTSVMITATVIMLYLGVLFFDAMHNDWVNFPHNGWFGHLEWQITALRIYFGFDMVGHFTEKLFAGSDVFVHMAGIFSGLGLDNPVPFVVMGGLAELGIAIGIGVGIFTRLAALGAAFYFLIANHFGHHFGLGFTWANSGGGWEYPMLMVFFYFSFVLTGAGKFSVDAWLIHRRLIPPSLHFLCLSKGHHGVK